MAVLSHGYPLLSFIASYVTLRRLLSEPARIERLRRSADDVPEIALTGALVGGAAWLLLCAAVLTPRPAWPASSLHAIVHALPQPISDPAQDGLAALAEYEAQEVVDCLEQRGLGEWGSATAKTGNAGAILISVRASHAQAPSDGALAALMLGLQNELMGRVDAIQIAPPTRGARLRFTPASSTWPVEDIASIPLTSNTQEADRHLAPRDPPAIPTSRTPSTARGGVLMEGTEREAGEHWIATNPTHARPLRTVSVREEQVLQEARKLGPSVAWRDDTGHLQTYHLKPSDLVTIGRAGDCTITFDHVYVSRQHATLLMSIGGKPDEITVSLLDVRSRHGTEHRPLEYAAVRRGPRRRWRRFRSSRGHPFASIPATTTSGSPASCGS